MSSLARVKLVPFNQVNPPFELSIDVEVKRIGSLLKLQYELKGKLDQIRIPSKNMSESASRLNLLWEKTCLEMFLSWGDEKFYWEMNLSPSGDWNFYHFENYRDGQKVENRIKEIKLDSVFRNASTWMGQVILDLSTILPPDFRSPLQLGLTAVIESQIHDKTYWAIQHLDSKPNFHCRESFCLRLD